MECNWIVGVCKNKCQVTNEPVAATVEQRIQLERGRSPNEKQKPWILQTRVEDKWLRRTHFAEGGIPATNN